MKYLVWLLNADLLISLQIRSQEWLHASATVPFAGVPVCFHISSFSYTKACLLNVLKNIHIASFILSICLIYLSFLLMIFFLFQFQCFLHGKFWKYQYWHTLKYWTDKINRKSKSWTQFERWSFKNVEKHVQDPWEESKFSWVYDLKCWNWLL